jgi:prepilin-type N-terminal cleavage/methylation domain-containing protein
MSNHRSDRGAQRRGFTIVEVIVAIMILAIGVLGLAATSGVVTRQLGRGNLQTIASTVAQSRFDSLASVPCANLAPTSGVNQTGTANTRGIRESWVISDSNDMKAIVDTIRFTGRTNALVYVSLLPCRD